MASVIGISRVVALAAGHGQGPRQVLELLLAFGLTALIGLERQLRGKAAGLRTQTLVGTAAALIVLVSKYGFADVLSSGQVVLDPSRVAAQIVSGIGFLGAGLIITRRGAIVGLTTAASVWETAAIGMAAGAGLPLLAAVVTALHFVVVFGFTALAHQLPGARRSVRLRVSYLGGQSALRSIVSACTERGWSIVRLVTGDIENDEHPERIAVSLDLTGAGDRDALLAVVAQLAGVRAVHLADEDLD